MDTEQKLDYLIKLADFYIARFDGRREFEWKVTLGLWGVLLGGIVAHSDLEVTLPVGLLIFFALLVVIAHWYWLWAVWRAHRTDKNYAFKLSRKAAELLDVELEPFVRKDLFKRFPPAMGFQLYITIMLVSINIFFFAN